jgi:ABC-2 type transport system permease protein
VYYPARVLAGTLAWPEVGRVVLVQLAWILGLLVLRAVLWRRGLRRYGAVGA